MTFIVIALSVVTNLLLIYMLIRKPVDQTAGLVERMVGQLTESVSGRVTVSISAELRASEKVVRDEFSRNREEAGGVAKQLREEVGLSVKTLGDSSLSQFGLFANRLDGLRTTVETKLQQMQESNIKKLDEMRHTVDEKLQGTLEKRLGESFKLVSDRLEQVHKGLGEMQSLAVGVGDLKKVLTNVKNRGTWGEIQLGNLLEQMLTPEQYEKNVQIKAGSTENVEFAICLPGKDEGGGLVYLPIDSKFPAEDYARLQDAQDRGDVVAALESAKMLETQIKKCARDIRDKYISPPTSTDFGILFLPVESLFAEVLRRPGLIDTLQREFRVTVAGPTTLAATLNALQMGFRSLAIQKRSSEVWKVLATVKNEFGKFGDILEKVGKKLEEAQNTIGDAASKSRNIERKLKGVEVADLPAPGSPEANFLLTSPDTDS